MIEKLINNQNPCFLCRLKTAQFRKTFEHKKASCSVVLCKNCIQFEAAELVGRLSNG